MRKTTAIMAAAMAGALAAGSALAADKIRVGFVYVGPVGDHGWTYRHDIGRQAVEKALGDKVETTYRRECRAKDRMRSASSASSQPAATSSIFTTSFGFMNPTLKVAKQFREDQVRARHRLQARRQRLDLHGALLRGPGYVAGIDRRRT